jgi:hypothetical protein
VIDPSLEKSVCKKKKKGGWTGKNSSIYESGALVPLLSRSLSSLRIMAPISLLGGQKYVTIP